MNPSLTIPDQTSSITSWIEWHKAMKDRYGKVKANSIFSVTWDKRGKSSLLNSEARDYFDKNGLVFDKDIFARLTDKAFDIGDFMGDIFTAGKWITVGVMVVVVGGAGLIIYNLGKDPVRSIGAAAKLKRL